LSDVAIFQFKAPWWGGINTEAVAVVVAEAEGATAGRLVEGGGVAVAGVVAGPEYRPILGHPLNTVS